ncbi:MAG: PaaI family thioesterase [Rhodospirillales bacterium]|jgi:uncharacterized protein (TIGR00369 family)|nr:PaaI family thioesterase [Rhodospirillales bacterium]|tara:strand:+ start:119 stop:550 length:432 start_codon:yes stop_codon:yes gene_type:complete
MSNETPERLTAEDIQAMFDRSPFISGLGLRVQSLDYDASELTVTMPLNPSLERRAGTKQFHGGPIASFIDTVGDFAIGMMVGGGVPTMNLRVDYLKPAVGDGITGTARVRRAGRTVAVVDIDVFDEKGSLVAVGRGTYSSKSG